MSIVGTHKKCLLAILIFMKNREKTVSCDKFVFVTRSDKRVTKSLGRSPDNRRKLITTEGSFDQFVVFNLFKL